MPEATNDKSRILLQGGEFDDSVESIGVWLQFLTETNNLKPGLPDLIVYFGFDRFNSIEVTFSNYIASLRSITLQLDLMDDDFAAGIFLRDSSEVESTSDDHLQPWILNLFSHSELETIRIPFKNSKLPDRFEGLTKLKSVDLCDSSLVELPPSFFRLPVLEQFNIRSSRLPELPAAVARLPLKSLSFSQPCKPELLGALTHLVELKCFRSNFHLPEPIGQLKQLRSLYLDSVSNAPAGLLDLDHLEKLTFRSKNASPGFGANPGKLTNLKELTTNKIDVFSEVLCNFSQLEKLTIECKADGTAINKLQQTLPKLQRLQYLSIDGTGIRDLDWCSSLTELKHLSLPNNFIERIPPEISRLKKLDTIILRNNPVDSFPEIDPMPGVTFIDLQDTCIPIDPDASTDIQPIPEELRKLKRTFPNVAYLSQMQPT